MKKYVFNLIAAVMLSVLSMVATAHVSNALAEKLIRKSGLWTQMETVPVQVQTGILQSPMKSLLPEAQVKRMVRIAGQSFAAARMRKVVVASIAYQMRPEQLEQAGSLRAVSFD